MERSKYLMKIIMLLMATTIFSQQNHTIYNAYVYNNMNEWKKVIDDFEKIPNKSNLELLELINYQYGYIAWCLGNDKDSQAEDYLDLADKNLEILEKKKFEQSMVFAYKSAFYGYRIGISNWKAPFIGPKSDKAATTAQSLDPNNWFVYLQLGNIKNYTPKIFGGSKSDALKYYLKSLELYESNTKIGIKDWNYLSLITTIAQAYEGTENFIEAKKFYEKVMKIEPNFTWVKNELYPKLLNKMKEKK